ncbi:hypothetical protein JKF63_04421 [Porcisia hertigi]|uniref:Uncharacterized protein n=1 Tax=Porcisia hertigi TaxID=2761500 RepID=A0A836I4N3_9TRYP|nr:hypothetical protein JKF63_04421 [Porcisia hertigi]
MPSLQEYWQSGFRGLHIEECINNAFADFAPYAGADQQRIVISRQTPTPGKRIGWCNPSSDSKEAAAAAAALGTPIGPASHMPSSSAVIVEDNGDFTVQMSDPRAGSMAFSTAGNMQMDAAVRLDMPMWPSLSQRTGRSSDEESSTAGVGKPFAASPAMESVSGAFGEDSANSVAQGVAGADSATPAVPPMLPVEKPAPSYLRFIDFTRPLTMPVSKAAPSHTPATRSPGPWGQLEVDISLPNWSLSRQSIGVRAGPTALRINHTLSAPTSTMNSTSLSDDDLLAATKGAGDDTKHRSQYTLDAAVCMPFGGSTPDGSRVVRRTLGGKPVVVLPAAPWALTCGMQLPLALGDTLVGISLQNNRASSVTLPFPGVEWVATAPAATLSDAPTFPADSPGPTASREHFEAYVPSLLYPRHNTSNAHVTIGSGDAAPSASAAAVPLYVAIPSISVSLLLVQTLSSHTLVRRDGSNLSASHLDNSGSGDGASANGSRIAASYDWRRLPTLIGVNVGFNRDQLRVSAASILHNGEVDLETAAVLDVTPWMPRMPSLLKLGYNNAGRLAAGMTSLFYETVTATLGVHKARGEQARFGIEVSF